jgi:hypothetical protein
MPDTFQALGVFVLALLPGAVYVWSFERQVGSWGVGLSDRVFRFIGVSAVFQALFAPFTYWLWRTYLATGKLAGGGFAWRLWLGSIAYVGGPFLAGWLVGRGTRSRAKWARFFTGPAPAPRAWDDLFFSRPDGWMRLRMKSGVWIGGAFTNDEAADLRSYAAGYPDEQDLYMAVSAEVDPESGEFILDDDGKPVTRDSGILVRWNEVEYLDFLEAKGADHG